MRVNAKHPETGETIFVDLTDSQISSLGELTEIRTTRGQIDSHIDNLNISADAKLLVSSVLDVSINVGTQIIKIGQKIVEFVLAITSKFPNTTFGLIFGLLLGALVSAIPLIGGLFGPLVLPLAAAFGLATGYMDDLKDKRLEDKLKNVVATFAPINGEVNVGSE